MLLLGGGAGIVMLPTLVTGPLALARPGWPRAVRGVLVGIVTINVLAIVPLLRADLSWLRTLVGWVLMVPLYGVIVWAISLNLRRHDDDAPLLRGGRAS